MKIKIIGFAILIACLGHGYAAKIDLKSKNSKISAKGTSKVNVKPGKKMVVRTGTLERGANATLEGNDYSI